MRVAVRGFAGKTKIFEETLEVNDASLERVAHSHMRRILLYPKHMIEIEFLDEKPSPNRFFRFGNDPSARVPIELLLDD